MNTSSGFQATIGGKRKMKARKTPLKRKMPPPPKMQGASARGQQMVAPNALGASGKKMKKKKGVVR